jgi:hypothetical protein
MAHPLSGETMDGVTRPGDQWGEHRRLIDELSRARSGKHGAFIVLRELWRWLAVNLPRRMWPRVLVIAAFVFGLAGLLVGWILKVLGGPSSLTGYGAGIGAVTGIAIAIVAFIHGAWLRRRVRRSLR